MKVITPPRDQIGYYTTPGDGDAIGKWLLDRGEEVDGFIVSVSMLAYGGLIGSRTGEQSPEDALNNIQVIKELKERYPQKPIYVYDTIQRLAVTAINDEYEKYYAQVREWAILYDKVHNLGMEAERERLEELEAAIPPHVLADYLQARERNHEINKLLIEWTNEQTIDYLILAQDDAAPYGLHRAERETLVQLVEDLGVERQVSVFPGADEVDVVLVSRFVNDLFGTSPSFYVEYGGIDGADWTAPFEDVPFASNVDKHIVSAGGTVTDDAEKADIHLLLNTPSAEEDKRAADIEKLVTRTQQLLKQKKKVAIGDVIYVNRADEAFVTKLAEEVDLTKIHAYSAWNTAGNALGITVGHAAVREALLQQTSGFGIPVYKQTAQAHYDFLLHRFAKDQGYKNVVQPVAREYVKALGAGEFALGDHYDQVNAFVDEHLVAETEKWYRYFDGKKVLIGHRGNKDFYSTISGLTDVYVKLPWPRIFEAELEPHLKMK